MVLTATRGAVASAVLFGLAWQLYFNATRKPQPVFAAYLSARIALVAWTIAICAMLRGTRYDHVHVHHLYLGWSLAVFADANHTISAVMLAVGAAIFVQGCGLLLNRPLHAADFVRKQRRRFCKGSNKGCCCGRGIKCRAR